RRRMLHFAKLKLFDTRSPGARHPGTFSLLKQLYEPLSCGTMLPSLLGAPQSGRCDMTVTEPGRGEYADEWPRIYERRRVAFEATESAEEGPKERPKDLVGLALSGGGLRSALFN